MRRLYFLAGMGVLVACLATWALQATAQPIPTDIPPPPPAKVGEEVPPPPLPPPLPSSSNEGGPGKPADEPKEPTRLPPPPPAPVPDVPPTPHEVKAPLPKSIDPPPAPEVKPTTPPAADPVVPEVKPEVKPPAPRATPPATLPADFGPTTPPRATPGVTSTSKAPAARGESESGPDIPTGRQEPVVTLEWLGSPVVRSSQVGDYAVQVRNTGSVPVTDVVLRVRIPAGLQCLGTEPKANPDGNLLIWEVGTLMPKSEKSVQLKLQAEARGDLAPVAWATFTTAALLRVSVREPKLALKVNAPEKVLIGDTASFTLSVSNPGDGSADQVKIHAVLSEGLEHARGNRIAFDIGSLAPGENRNVTLLCATRAGGPQKCEVTAEANGGLKARDTGAFTVLLPRLDLQLAGPGLRYLDRKALYTIKVTNPSDVAATNVTVADRVPPGFKVLAASPGARHDAQTRTVTWFLGEIGPGQSREVKLEVQAAVVGDHIMKAGAVGARGLRAEAEKLTRVEGLAALMVEMVDLEDPIESGGSTGYEVKITNTGSKPETDIKLAAILPEKMQFVGVQGDARFRQEGRSIAFEPIAQLAPRQTATFRINVKALEPGTVLFKIQVTSANLLEPVIKMEATRIYADAPEAEASPGPAPAKVKTPGEGGVLPPPPPGEMPKTPGSPTPR